MKTNTTFRNFR